MDEIRAIECKRAAQKRLEDILQHATRVSMLLYV